MNDEELKREEIEVSLTLGERGGSDKKWRCPSKAYTYNRRALELDT